MSDETSRTIEAAVACIRCGYDLRGIAVDGACPECGAGSVQSLAASRVITKRDVAKLATRTMALWFIVYALLNLSGTVVYVAFELFNAGAFSDLGWALTWFVQEVISLGLGVLLWSAAGWISRCMVPVDGTAVPTQQWTATDLASTAVCVLGLYLLVSGAAGLASVAWQLLIGGEFDVGYYDAYTWNPVSAGSYIVAGLVLIAGRRRLAGWWHAARTAGTPKSPPAP